MGMYTEFYFRASLKEGPVADWLEAQIVGGDNFDYGFDDHQFFQLPRWRSIFIGGGAVYQESRYPILRRKTISYREYKSATIELVLASSLKNYSDEIEHFIDWITPHLDSLYGEFPGYSLYEASVEDSDPYREHPILYFYGREPVYS